MTIIQLTLGSNTGHDSGWVAEIRFSLLGSAGARCAEKKFGRSIGYLRFHDPSGWDQNGAEFVVLVKVTAGMTDASMTRRPSMLRPRNSSSSTVIA